MLNEQQKSILRALISEQPSLSLPDYLAYVSGLDDTAASELINNYATDKVVAIQETIQSRQNDITLIQQAIDVLNQSITEFTL